MLLAMWAAGGITVAILAALVIVVLLSDSGPSTGSAEVPDGYPYPVQAIERIPERGHFAVGEVYNGYNSNPPTSGPHAAVPATWGISDSPVPKEKGVHNMEHGGAVVWYNCNAAPALTSDQCTQLRNQLGQVVQQEYAAGNRVVMTPYDGMDHHIALTAWGFLDAFDDFDGERVRLFIETFECNYDPENFC
jgi:hypothetical protein